MMKRTTYGIYVNGIHVDIIESAWPAHRVMKTQRRRFPNAKQLSVKSIIGGVDDKEEALKDVDSKILVDVLGVD